MLTQDIGRSPMYNCALRPIRIRNDHHNGDAFRAVDLTQNRQNYQAAIAKEALIREFWKALPP
jgi:hypothetical protein